MGTWFYEYNRERNPFGGWKYRRDLEEELLLKAARRGEGIMAALERLKRICSCCHGRFVEGRIEQCICEPCLTHLRCVYCRQDFEVGDESFGLVCAHDWRIQVMFIEDVAKRSKRKANGLMRDLARKALGFGRQCRYGGIR